MIRVERGDGLTDDLLPNLTRCLVPDRPPHVCSAAIEVQPVLSNELADVEPEPLVLGEFGNGDGLGRRLREQEESVAVVGGTFCGVGWDVGCVRIGDIEREGR